MKKNVITSLSIGAALLWSAGNALAITTDGAPTAEELVDKMLGSDFITVDNVTLTCAGGASGTFGSGESAVGIPEGIILSSGNIADVIGPNDHDDISTNMGTPGDADLDALIGETTYDACVLEFDFQLTLPEVPSASVAFNYVFASDEYNEYVDQFNDVFAFFMDNGGDAVNIALIPGTTATVPVSINTVNQDDNSDFYINNDDCQGNPASCPVPDTQMDGLTTVLSTADVEVVPGQKYHLKLAIADTGDPVLDSNVLIEAGSFKIGPVAKCKDVTLNLDSNGQALLSPFQVDNGSYDPDGQNVTFGLSKTGFNCSDVGMQPVTLTVIDEDGMEGQCEANVTVVDNVAPDVKAQDITVQLNSSGTASITAENIDNGSSDNCCIASRTIDKNSFTCSDAGQNTVTLTVTDCNGNSSSASATVIVQDKVPPVVKTKDISILLDETTKTAVIDADAVDDGSTDNCCIASKSISKSEFTYTDLTIGLRPPQTVTLTVTDCNGNSSSATAAVTVQTERLRRREEATSREDVIRTRR